MATTLTFTEEKVTVDVAVSKAGADIGKYTEIILADTVKELGNNVFEYFSALEYLHCPKEPPKVGVGNFIVPWPKTKICVPIGCIDKYKSSSGWNDPRYIDNITNCVPVPDPVDPPEPVTCKSKITWEEGEVEIYDVTYKNVNKVVYVNKRDTISKVELCSEVEEIGDDSFSRCTDLSTVEFGGTSTVGRFAFYGCPNINDISIDHASQLEEGAFQKCGALNDVSFGTANVKIGDYCFADCEKLKVITWDKVGGVGSRAFSYCKSLEEVSLNNVGRVGDRAFSNCTSLTTVNLENNTSLGDGVFRFCTSLERVYCNIEEPPTIGDNVFSDTNDNFIIYVPCKSYTKYVNDRDWSVYKEHIEVSDKEDVKAEVLVDNTTKVITGSGTLTKTEITNILEDKELLTDITKIEIYCNVDAIEEGVFNGMTELATLIVYALEPPVLVSGSFDDLNKLKIYVPEDYADLYRDADGWKDYSSIIKSF